MEPSVPPKLSTVLAPAPLTVRDFLRAEVQKSIEARLRECQCRPIGRVHILFCKTVGLLAHLSFAKHWGSTIYLLTCKHTHKMYQTYIKC